jgi:hypothetical protein
MAIVSVAGRDFAPLPSPSNGHGVGYSGEPWTLVGLRGLPLFLMEQCLPMPLNANDDFNVGRARIYRSLVRYTLRYVTAIHAMGLNK